MKVQLCKCNNCNNIYIDQNSQVNQPEFEIEQNKYSDLQYLKEKNSKYYYWGCPVCETDGYLIDITNILQINYFS
jgi:hypothetical protein